MSSRISRTSPSLVTGPVRSMISSFDSAVGGRRGVMRSVGCRPLVSEIELTGAKILVPRRLRRRTVQGLVQVAHLPAEFPPEIRGFLILAIWRHPILARHDDLRGTHTDARRTGRKVGTPKSSKNFARERRVRAGFSVTEKFHPSLSSRPATVRRLKIGHSGPALLTRILCFFGTPARAL